MSDHPVKRQMQMIRQRFPGVIVFYRIGDFFEAYGDDAAVVAKSADVKMMHRKIEKEKVPVAGVPFFAAEAAIAKLVAEGHRVAIAEKVGS